MFGFVIEICGKGCNYRVNFVLIVVQLFTVIFEISHLIFIFKEEI